MAIVYLHTRLDTDVVFYVGIGKDSSRAFSKKNRSKYWHNIVSSVGYRVDIIVQDVSWDVAVEFEKRLIAEHGRKDLGTGELVNMTGGGDGSTGRLYLEETRKKQQIATTGRPKSTESIQKRSASRSGKPRKQETKDKLRLANLGKKHTEETKQKMSEARKGRKGTPHTEEAKQKMRGRKFTDEHKHKLSEARKKSWEMRKKSLYS